ncbi:MAG: hypothetical protein J6M48_10810 [Ruminococcus sp.]|nr:hypothetical protein [Ruminococcus sp.]
MTFWRLAAALAVVSLLFGCSEKKSEPSSSEESSAVSEEVTEAETDPAETIFPLLEESCELTK